MDLEHLEYVQESILNSCAASLETEGTTPGDLEERQEQNKEIYLPQLKSIIIENKIWMLERLRLWRWREEVFLDRTGEALEDYPGLPMIFEFESSTELITAGVNSYFLRVGEVKRETLMEMYYYFDLYHMAGILSSGVKRDASFTTDMKFEDLADLVIQFLDEMKIDPRHLLTPLGVRIIYNREKIEVIFNCYKHQLFDDDGDLEALYLACSHAGIDRSKVTDVEQEDGTIIRTIDNKPIYILMDELISQYLSPQFYTGIEAHRDFMSAIKRFTTPGGKKITRRTSNAVLTIVVGMLALWALQWIIQ